MENMNLFSDGQVQIYNIHCELIKSFSLGAAFKTDPLGDCIIWSTGLIARTGGSFNFVAVTNFDQPKPSPLPKLSKA